MEARQTRRTVDRESSAKLCSRPRVNIDDDVDTHASCHADPERTWAHNESKRSFLELTRATIQIGRRFMSRPDHLSLLRYRIFRVSSWNASAVQLSIGSFALSLDTRQIYHLITNHHY